MPLYDYDCAACGRRVEVVHGVHAPGPTHCPNCGSGPLRKAITAPAIHFKGTGWAKKERRATATTGAGKDSGDGAGEGAGSDKGAKGGTKDESAAASKGTSASDAGSETTSASPSKPAGTATKAD